MWTGLERSSRERHSLTLRHISRDEERRQVWIYSNISFALWDRTMVIYFLSCRLLLKTSDIWWYFSGPAESRVLLATIVKRTSSLINIIVTIIIITRIFKNSETAKRAAIWRCLVDLKMNGWQRHYSPRCPTLGLKTDKGREWHRRQQGKDGPALDDEGLFMMDGLFWCGLNLKSYVDLTDCPDTHSCGSYGLLWTSDNPTNHERLKVGQSITLGIPPLSQPYWYSKGQASSESKKVSTDWLDSDGRDEERMSRGGQRVKGQSLMLFALLFGFIGPMAEGPQNFDLPPKSRTRGSHPMVSSTRLNRKDLSSWELHELWVGSWQLQDHFQC